jgi:phosphoribosylamine--glycine ligase
VRILVIGNGAREHAIARSLAADVQTTALFVAPGNPGTAEIAENRSVDPVDPEAVAGLAVELAADLVVVGPEVPLVAGVADAVRQVGIACFGPGAQAARLEGSKAYAKEIMAAAGVPTAMAHVCTDASQAESALDAFGAPYVVKDDGLAAGKGVVVTEDRAAALAHAERCLAREGGAVVVEEYLDGPEVSLFCASLPPRTTSAWATGTPGRTPAGWAPTRRCHGRRPTSRTTSSPGSRSPPWTS